MILALLVNQKLRGRTFFRTLFFLPVILGVVIQSLMWKLFLQPRGGPMATMFGWLGLESEFLGGQPGEAFAWVIVVQIWANVGITMVIFLAGMQTINTDLYEAARIDGASGWQLFRNVTWPQLTPAINTNFLLNIIGSLQAWQLFLVLIGYRPGTQVLGYVVYAEGFGQGESPAFRQGFAAAASIVLFLFVLIFGIAATARQLEREEVHGMSVALDNALAAADKPASVATRSRLVKVSSYFLLSLVAVFYVWPLFMLINTALKDLPQFLKDPAAIVSEPSLANFGKAWQLANFSQYVFNSVLYTVIATAIFVATSLFVAFPIARGYFKGSNAILTLYVVALFLPPALIPQFQLILKLGLYNTRPGFILLFLVNPIGMIILVNYMKSIPREFDE